MVLGPRGLQSLLSALDVVLSKAIIIERDEEFSHLKDILLNMQRLSLHTWITSITEPRTVVLLLNVLRYAFYPEINIEITHTVGVDKGEALQRAGSGFGIAPCSPSKTSSLTNRECCIRLFARMRHLPLQASLQLRYREGVTRSSPNSQSMLQGSCLKTWRHCAYSWLIRRMCSSRLSL